jgi:hypothetical protein
MTDFKKRDQTGRELPNGGKTCYLCGENLKTTLFSL